MPWWVAKPARVLAAFETASIALAVTYPLAGLLLGARPSLWALFAGVLLIVVSPIGVFGWVRAQHRGLGWLLYRARRGWIAPLTLSGVFALGLLDWRGWSAPVGVALSGLAFAVAVWCLVIARRAGRWVSGRLERGVDLHLRCDGATYVLDRAPRGADVGDWLTFPDVAVSESARGPYRSGRPRGLADVVLPWRREVVRLRLMVHGAAFLVWSVVGMLAAVLE